MKRFIVHIVFMILLVVGGLYILHVETTQGFFIPNIFFFYNILIISAFIAMRIIQKEEKDE
ncbi:hypothetical protein L5F37_07435 [Aliarcobacter butzleri]|uniref:hypothetical protein n=1 Tax=Aliarcobacter butzleri TaxID=28197 RepID=UPI001EDC4344|nr:hypothetical protein [Aliarcobacter butzleri]MCG3663226.1 hypothetical protein [Aliarcobacter butzleri]